MLGEVLITLACHVCILAGLTGSKVDAKQRCSGSTPRGMHAHNYNIDLDSGMPRSLENLQVGQHHGGCSVRGNTPTFMALEGSKAVPVFKLLILTPPIKMHLQLGKIDTWSRLKVAGVEVVKAT